MAGFNDLSHLLIECAHLAPVAVELFSVIRVGDVDECIGSFVQRPPVQICHAILRHNIVDVCAGCDDARTWVEGSNKAWLALACPAGEGDDRLTPFGERSPSYKVHLSPHAGNNPMANRVCTDLSCQVHLHR